MAFPSSLDSFPTILSSTKQNDTGFELDLLLNKAFDAIEQLEAKVGTGVDTPAGLPGVLRSAGGGSEWAVVQAVDIASNAVTIRPAAVTGSTDPTTTNSAVAALANPTLVITIPSGMTADVYVWVNGAVADATGGSLLEYQLRIDGGGWTIVSNFLSHTTVRHLHSGFTVFPGIVAGAHTIEVGNSSSSSNTITHYGTTRRLMALGISK